MVGKFSIGSSTVSIDRFIVDHGLDVLDIRRQPFLGSDVSWELTKDGWVILLYPRAYYEGPAEELILLALSSIFRRTNPWFEDTPAEEFNGKTEEFLNSRPTLSEQHRELYATCIVSFDQAMCSCLELHYLLDHGYIDSESVRRLADYLMGHFVTHKGALEFVAAMAALRATGCSVTDFYENVIKNKWYEFLKLVDEAEVCINQKRVRHADVVNIFNIFFPDFKEGQLLERIALLRRNVIGPRDEREIDFDIAISFAGEDRTVARRIAELLRCDGISLFFDEYLQAELLGKDLRKHLTDVYKRRAKFCVMIISKHYEGKLWPTVEREAAVSRAVEDSAEYIIPLRLDDTDVPGLSSERVYIDLRERSVDEAGELIAKRVRLLR